MITFFSALGFLGFIITILVVIPATLIAFATIIEHPIKTILTLWTTLIETYKELWQNLTK
jgi:hypothetical protein